MLLVLGAGLIDEDCFRSAAGFLYIEAKEGGP